MKKSIQIEIVSCKQCPYSQRDYSGCGLQCLKTDKKPIYWFGSDEEKQACGEGCKMNYIPDWCPFPEKK